MSIEIKTATMEPIRQSYANIERRFGEKPASRYQEATYDLQAEVNFHYRPLWQPEYELNDKARTAIVMADWYDLKDPRQFYYGTYVQHRAKLQEQTENSYSFFEKRNLADNLSPEVRDLVINYMIPLRHAEHTANLNNMYGCAFGYGTAITQALIYNAMDRLGLAQYLSRIGLILDGNTASTLAEAKQTWLENSVWQGLRALCEETTTIKDWFEVILAQNLVIDSLMYSIFYVQLDAKLVNMGGRDIALLTEIFHDWNKDASRWFDSILKTAAAESETNKEQLTQWVKTWRNKAVTAFKPLAEQVVGAQALEIAEQYLDERLNKIGLS